MNISQGLTKRTLTIAFENCLCRTALNVWHIYITSSSFASCKMRMSLVGYQISSNLSMAVFLDCQKLCVFRNGFFKSFSVMSADLRPNLRTFKMASWKQLEGPLKFLTASFGSRLFPCARVLLWEIIAEVLTGLLKKRRKEKYFNCTPHCC